MASRGRAVPTRYPLAERLFNQQPPFLGKECTMRKGILMLIAAMFMTSTLPAFAQMTQSQKDECMLASKNCTDQVDDIYRRMHRLDKEIKKGKRVYTKEELKMLQQKLSETQELLKTMEKPGK
jgi:hypothetical protein